MAVTQFQKPRPKCRVCGSRAHVITVGNPRSPMVGCCASCGVVARQLSDWFELHSSVELERIAQHVREVAAARAAARPLLERMG